MKIVIFNKGIYFWTFYIVFLVMIDKYFFQFFQFVWKNKIETYEEQYIYLVFNMNIEG